MLKLGRKYSSGTEGKKMYMYSRAVLVKLMRHKIYCIFSVSKMYRSKVDLELWTDACPSKHTENPYVGPVYSKNILVVSSVVWAKIV